MDSASKQQDMAIARLTDIMEKLRDPITGCAWDLKQSMPSLIEHTLEEAYEVADAIYRGDANDICEELGDLLFQIVFYSQIASEQGTFTFTDVTNSISDKLIRRHPHVFDDKAKSMSADEVAIQWQKIKSQEKSAKLKTRQRVSVFDNLTSGKPALMRASQLQKACASVGFDWDHVTPVIEKVSEEIEELKQEIGNPNPSRLKQEEEFGDLMFAMVNLARHLGIDADTALQKANLKFEKRFRQVEQLVAAEQQNLSTMSLEVMEAFWQQVKHNQINK